MLNKKAKSVLFIFLILFCIAAVNAESNNTDTDIQSVNIIDVKSDTYVAAIDDAAVTTGTFSDLNSTINDNKESSSITLGKNYTYNEGSDEDLKEGIIIDRNLTIDGNGFTIDGNHSARIFNVTASGTLTLKNIILINAYSDDYGGAIYNNGTLNIFNSIFINNSAKYEGGAICSKYGNLSVTNSTFINNTASEGEGGGLNIDEGNAIITNSKFINNTAENEGGAIRAEESNISVINSEFINNTADMGGAIFCEEYNLTIINSSFIYNRADDGGALFVEGKATITDSTFINNTVKSSGGAIGSEDSNLTITNSIFSNNTANYEGGAIFSGYGTITIVNSSFSNNTAKSMGGAVYIEDCNVTVINSEFIENSIEEDGGAVYIEYGNLTVINSSFINNAAEIGGAISSEYANITVVNSEFINNKAEYEGGAICSYEGNVNITDSKFVNNTAEDSGGAMVTHNGNVTIADSTFTNNSIFNGEGGAIYCEDGDITVNNSIFSNNTITEDGEGGAIFCDNGDVNVINSSFINNIVNQGAGGAIFCQENMIVVNSSFIGNRIIEESEGGAGAIYCDYNLTIINSEFINNSVANYGGAIIAENGATIINSIFVNNTSTEYEGGAIYSDGVVTVINSTFINNKVDKESEGGGAIYSWDDVIVINSTFINNRIKQNNEEEDDYYDNYGGGAICSVDGNIIIINSTFINNSAEYNGGAIYTEEGNINITNSTFIGNSAVNGGAIYGSSNITITDSKFFDNNATKGGAIYYGDIFENDVCLTITSSTFDGNQGKFGDDIYTEHNTTVRNNTFSRSSYANIYANNTIINCSVISALENTTYYVLKNSTFKVYAMVLADGASVNGYNITIIDKVTSVTYNTTYVGQGKYESTVDILANFTVRPYTANLTIPEELEEEDLSYIIQDGLVSTEKQNVTIEATVDETIFGENVTGNITIRDANGKLANFTGEVTIEVNGKNYTVNITDGKGSFVIDDKLPAGNYTLNVYFKGSERYNPSTNSTDFEIGKATPDLDVNITDIEGNLTMDIIMNPDINGNVTVIIDNETFVVEIRNGSGKLDLSDLESGTHEFTVSFEGNNNYNSAEAEGEFDIDKGIVLEVNDLTKYYGNDRKLEVRLRDSRGNPLANQTVTIKINGVTYTRATDENGTVLMSINLIPGVYETEVSYENLTETINVTIISTIQAEDLIKYFKNGSQYYAKFLNVDGTPLANANVTFNIHGVFYTRTTDENGIAKLNINLNPGEYIITAFNPVNNESKANVVTVLSTIFGENVVKFYRNGTQYYAYVLDENGNPLANANVTFNIHGVFYNRTTDEEGMVKLNINLNPGEYIITVWNLWNGEATSNNITVYTVVESEDLEMTTLARKPFKVTILGEQGKPLANANVTFNIHGVFYHKTTDANGQISLDINLIAGKYIITTYYNEYSISNTIVVK